MIRPLFIISVFALIGSTLHAQTGGPSRIIVSVHDQKLVLVENGARIATYPVSTSKFGIGDDWGRMTTPLGFLQVAQKIGDHAPTGAVFHNRRFTGEILRPNAPGRDPIITRIIWLRGLEPANAHAFSRCIYIHGTPEEKLIGKPASYGCIRMKSRDVTDLYNQVPLGTVVEIVPDKLPRMPKAPRGTVFMADYIKPEAQNVNLSKDKGRSPQTPERKSAGAAGIRRDRSTYEGVEKVVSARVVLPPRRAQDRAGALWRRRSVGVPRATTATERRRYSCAVVLDAPHKGATSLARPAGILTRSVLSTSIPVHNFLC